MRLSVSAERKRGTFLLQPISLRRVVLTLQGLLCLAHYALERVERYV